MKPLMPAAVKGINIFRAAHASQAIPDSGPGDNFGDNESEGVNPYNADESQPQTPPATEIEANEEHIPWSPSPSSPSGRLPWPFAKNLGRIRESNSILPEERTSLSSMSPSAGPSNDHKRRHSAISSGSTSATNTAQKRTRRDASSASALHGLTAKLDSFSGTFLEGIALATPATSTLAPSPMRKTRAITRAQELEVDLDDARLAALIRIFQSDVNAADAYMVINRAGLRKAWIEDTLPIM
jgi:hypothetical protein